MTIPQAFADIALAFSGAGLGAFHDAIAKWPGTPTMTSGGSIDTPGTPTERECSVQVDAVTEAMRLADGYTDKDMRLLVLTATLEGDLNTDATIDVLAGPHMGEWMLASCDRDPCGVYFECRGRLLNVSGEPS